MRRRTELPEHSIMNKNMGSIIIISLALALGTYGIAAQRGTNLVRLDRYTLLMSAIWGIMELAAAFTGYGAGRWILTREVVTEHNLYWVHVLAGLLLAAVGLRMLMQAFRKKSFFEHRMERVDIKADVLLSLRLCLQALFLGIACGLLMLGSLLLFRQMNLEKSIGEASLALQAQYLHLARILRAEVIGTAIIFFILGGLAIGGAVKALRKNA